MTKAKFRIDFGVETYFAIDKEMEVQLPEESLIILHESKDKNQGSIFIQTDQLDEEIALNKGKKTIENYLNCLLITKESFEFIEAINFSHAKLINSEDFKGEVISFFRTFPIEGLIYQTLEKKELDVARDFLVKIEGLSKKEQDIIYRSLRWFRKASETSKEDKFIYSWISFEALLGLLEKERLTHNLIQEFIDKYLKTEKANKIFDVHEKNIIDLSVAELISFRNVNYSEKLRNFLNKKEPPRNILPKSGLCIYEVRNKLLHKGNILQLIEGCTSLLRDLIRGCLTSYLLG